MAKIGRPRGSGAKVPYNPIYCQKIIDFFKPPYFLIKDITITKPDGTKIEKTEMEPIAPIFLSDFAATIGIKKGYGQIFSVWKERYPEFAEALKEAKELETQLYRTNGSLGLYNVSFSIFTLKNIAGWRDAHNLDHSGLPQPIINVIQNYAETDGNNNPGKSLPAPRIRERDLEEPIEIQADLLASSGKKDNAGVK